MAIATLSEIENLRKIARCFSGVNELLLSLLSNDNFDEEQKEVIRSLQTYLNNNRERLNYRERLFEGRAIGN
jgi:hypothetical protein